LDRQQLYKLYSIADIGVLLSLYEQGSFSVIEMLAHGIPLIISDVDGLKETSKEGGTLGKSK